MVVKLPYRSDSSVPQPTAVQAHANGKLPNSLFQPCGLRSFAMVEPAARAMRAMVAAARRDGIALSATSTWRSYDQQLWLFKDRYVTYNTGQPTKTWNGKRYWRRPGVASAATPGTSNHGWGVAADLSDTPSTPLSETYQRWLADHGPSFGYWNTVESEVWHWSYCLGDAIPQAVLDTESGLGLQPPPQIDWTSVEEVETGFGDIAYPGVLKEGSVGPAVSAVQWKLDAAGHDVKVDGDFGSKTAAAVRAFQEANNLEVDGIVGQVTWGALGLGTGAAANADMKKATVEISDAKAKRPPAPAGGDEATYTVRDGDGLLRIARLTLWSEQMTDAEAIATSNGLQTDSVITPGQELRIEKCRSTVAVRGDGWLAVSKRLDRTADEVLEHNAWQGDILHPGMIIYGGKSGG